MENISSFYPFNQFKSHKKEFNMSIKTGEKETEKKSIKTSAKAMNENPNIGIKLIVKFYLNEKNGKKSLITRTLGKIGLVEGNWIREHKNTNTKKPQNKEFWVVEIADEIFPGKNRGCFILRPISEIASIDIMKLVGGFYSEEVINGILYIHPNRHELPWILPLSQKQAMADNKEIYAILVPLEITEVQAVTKKLSKISPCKI